MMRSLTQTLKSLTSALANPGILLYALPWLMFLLVSGTIAQRYIGLFESEKLFFGSFLFWLGPVPLPGAYTTLGIIALCLAAKLLFKSRWEKRQAGIILTHISVFILLVGALVTTLYREEGYMVLGADETENRVSDYHLRELAIFKNGSLLLSVPQNMLQQNSAIASLPFALRIEKYYSHCQVQPRKEPEAGLRGAAKKVEIASAPASKEDAENKSGVVFEIKGVSASQNGIYIASEALAESPVITLGKDRYEIVLRPTQRLLPFAIHLLRFEKSDYPGTDMARSYRSDVTVIDGSMQWNATIEMNQPLRHAGYTLYQSSFVNNDGKLLTVLAIVKNAGALFPYIAIATLCAGLLLHLGIMISSRRQS